jgi:hypothetical protein
MVAIQSAVVLDNHVCVNRKTMFVIDLETTSTGSVNGFSGQVEPVTRCKVPSRRSTHDVGALLGVMFLLPSMDGALETEGIVETQNRPSHMLPKQSSLVGDCVAIPLGLLVMYVPGAVVPANCRHAGSSGSSRHRANKIKGDVAVAFGRVPPSCCCNCSSTLSVSRCFCECDG